jgi:hypothetical protein
VSALILQAIRAEPAPVGGRRGRKPSAVFRSAGGVYTSEVVEEMLERKLENLDDPDSPVVRRIP